MRAILACSLIGLGCARQASPPSAPVASSHAPRPFTADQIRDAMPVGTEIRYRLEAEGSPTRVQHWTVTAADAQGCTIAARALAEDGTLIEDLGAGTSTWTELVEHATFPADTTTIADSSVEVPAGRFETKLYEVRSAEGEVKRFHFAPSLPGPPVSFTIERGGVVVQRLVLVERTSPQLR